MEKVTVTTTATHIDDQGITRKIGDTYETAKNYAGLRKGSGLVDFDGEGVKVTGQPLLHAGVSGDSGTTTTAIVDSEDGKMVAVKKSALEAGKAETKAVAAKKVAPKKAAKEKVETPQPEPEKQEGGFPGSPATTEQ